MVTDAHTMTRRAYSLLRQDGWVLFFRKLQKKIIRECFQTTCSLWLNRDLDEPADAAPRIAGFAIRFLDTDRDRLIDWLKQKHETFPWIYFPKELAAARESEHIFVSLEREGTIVGHLKVGIRRIYVHDYDSLISLPPGTAFVYDIFVLPEYRGRHYAFFALQQTIRYLSGRGYSTLWCHIEPWNQASLRLFKRAGFKEQGRIRFSRIFKRSIFVRDGYLPMSRMELFLTGERRS